MIHTLTGWSRCLSLEGGVSRPVRMGGCGQEVLLGLLVFCSPRFGMALVLSLCSVPHSRVGLQWACEDASLGPSRSVFYSLSLAQGNTCF